MSCPGPGNRGGNFPVLPASKEAESPSNLFYVDSMRGGGGGLEVVKSKVMGEINFWKSLESSSAEGGEITRVQEKGKGPLHQITVDSS